ncbi:MAG: hypothetical protein HY840_13325 [Bacteroidetes bacterium]|nr:hypothetical protein [Bacteroidota bacterium]
MKTESPSHPHSYRDSQREGDNELTSSPLDNGRFRPKVIGRAARPIILTIFCIVGILWSMGNFVFVFSPSIKKISDWAPAIYGIIVALQFISFIGIWYMKRWGVMICISVFLAKIIFSVFVNDISYVGIGLSVVFTVFFLIFYRRMDEEL